MCHRFDCFMTFLWPREKKDALCVFWDTKWLFLKNHFFKHRRCIMPKATACEGFMSPKREGGVNQWLIKTFVFLIDNRCEVCYTVGVIKSQIQPKEAFMMMKTYIDRIVFVSPAVCWMSGLYTFYAHPISGVLFVCQAAFGASMLLCTRRGAFAPSWGLFLWKALEYASNGKFDNRKGEFFMTSPLMHLIEFEEERRRCPWRD